MKKFAIGCGIVLVLGAIAAGVFAYWAFNKARDFVGTLSQFEIVTTLDAQLTNQTPFETPASNELTAAQVERFMAVSEHMRTGLGTRFEELRRRYDQIEAMQRTEGRSASATEVLGALKDLAGVVGDLKRAQVAALNASNMSIGEYRWLRDQVYAAAEVPFASFSVSAFVEAAKSGNPDRITEALSGRQASAADVPAVNKELVKPHAQKLRDWAVLAWI
jgi:hypothetical protein